MMKKKHSTNPAAKTTYKSNPNEAAYVTEAGHWMRQDSKHLVLSTSTTKTSPRVATINQGAIITPPACNNPFRATKSDNNSNYEAAKHAKTIDDSATPERFTFQQEIEEIKDRGHYSQ